MRLLLCLLCLSLFATSVAEPDDRPRKKSDLAEISVVFVDTDLVSALQFLAGKMNRTLHIDWGVEGTVSANLWGITPEAALIRVLAMQPKEYQYVLVGGESSGLFVDRKENLSKIESIFGRGLPARLPDRLYLAELILEEGSVEKVVEFLKAEYENVEFAVRSEPTGFYALGSREDLLQVKRELSNGDVDMRAILSRTFRVREAEPEDLVRFLARELPDLDFKHDGLEIEITGPRYRLYDFEALIDYLDSSDFYLKGWLYSRYVGPELDFSGVRWCPR